MEYMKTLPDKAFDLAIVDPPYGISATRFNMGSGYCNGNTIPKDKNYSQRGSLKVSGKLKNRVLNTMGAEWDATPPLPEYFKELRRVSMNQIIWGGNYFDLPPTRCVGCWDKQQPWENFSQREMVLAHKRGAWDLVVWLAEKARTLRLATTNSTELSRDTDQS
jgi:site-specific DNA-methyltransferase (adenine-specific)